MLNCSLVLQPCAHSHRFEKYNALGILQNFSIHASINTFLYKVFSNTSKSNTNPNWHSITRDKTIKNMFYGTALNVKLHFTIVHLNEDNKWMIYELLLVANKTIFSYHKIYMTTINRTNNAMYSDLIYAI